MLGTQSGVRRSILIDDVLFFKCISIAHGAAHLPPQFRIFSVKVSGDTTLFSKPRGHVVLEIGQLDRSVIYQQKRLEETNTDV